MTPERFIRKICHDLRAPLRGMKEIPDWLGQDLESYLKPVPAPILELLHMMKSQASQLDTIIIGLSELAKLERREKHPRSLIPGNPALENLPQNLRHQIDVDICPLEQDHLAQVVKHLVDNAYQHAQAEKLSATLLIARSAAGFHIAVRDHGPGIDECYLEKIFEPLYTLKSRDDLEASGMGLAVVAKIAALYGGECEATPNLNAMGTTFELCIPNAAE